MNQPTVRTLLQQCMQRSYALSYLAGGREQAPSPDAWAGLHDLLEGIGVRLETALEHLPTEVLDGSLLD